MRSRGSARSRARPSRSTRQAKDEFKSGFSSAEPLLKLGLTPRAAEALLWLAQGKTNPDIATILGITESTVKKHVQEIFEKFGVETRDVATVWRAGRADSLPQRTCTGLRERPAGHPPDSELET